MVILNSQIILLTLYYLEYNPTLLAFIEITQFYNMF